MTSCCQCAAPAVEPPAEDRPPSIGWLRLGFAGAVAAQSMIFTLAVNLSPPTGPARLVLHAALALSAVVVLILVGPPLVRAAFRPRIAFEQLFLAGIFGAFGASLVSTITGVGHVYYEVVAILLAIYTLGRLLGERRRRAALDAARALGAEFETCERFSDDGTIRVVPVREIRVGDRVHVPSGAAVPVDGVVEGGAALVDESTLTGEPFPVARRAGDSVLAGSRLVDGPLQVRAAVPGAGRLLDTMFARVRAAQAGSSRLEREADRLVTWFLPLVLAVAAVTFCGWTAHAGWMVGMFNALAVILVACPCSMGLATPIGVWSALSDLARRGVVPATSDLVERLAAVRQVVFDKTGTLSEEHLELVDFVNAPSVDRERLLAEAAAVEFSSLHPVARAFRRFVSATPAGDVRPIPGIGIEGRVGKTLLRIGNAALLDPARTVAADALRSRFLAVRATHEIYLVRDGVLVGIARLRERLREATRSVIAELESAGIRCTVLTGDRSAAEFSRAETGLSPLDKAERIRALEREGPVLFVGDGLNDAPAMAESRASLALVSGNPLAREVATGEIRDLRTTPYAIGRCRRAVRVIRQNLLFAAAYNVVGIALAAAGMLHPIAAALLMLASSFTVSWRALRRDEGPLPKSVHASSTTSTSLLPEPA